MNFSSIYEDAVTCKICGINCKSTESLSNHILIHKVSRAGYFREYWNKKDLLTGETLEFTKVPNYSELFFINKNNLIEWTKITDKNHLSLFCHDIVKLHCQNKKLKFAPTHVYMMTHPRLPFMRIVRKNTNFNDLMKECGLEYILNQKLDGCPDILNINNDIEIVVDTREQRPLEFDYKTQLMKLDFGDYTLNGEYYNSIFVDRKSDTDLIGTLSYGLDRFKRELDKVRHFNAYLFVVTESTILNINNNPYLSQKMRDFSWEMMREIISEYSDVCQFIFTGSRENSEQLIPYILYHGQKLKNVDLQYFLEEKKCLG